MSHQLGSSIGWKIFVLPEGPSFSLPENLRSILSEPEAKLFSLNFVRMLGQFRVTIQSVCIADLVSLEAKFR